MTTRSLRAAALVAAGLSAASIAPAWAADDAATADIRRQIEQMRSDYEARIRELEQRLDKTASDASSAKAAAAEAKAQAAAPPPPPVETKTTAANAFNPAISGVLNGTFTSFNHDPSKASLPGFVNGPEFSAGDKGFSLGESEIAANADIDQALYANLVLSFNRDDEVEVEEGYIQTTSLPWGFTLRGGKFFSGIGYLNEKHAHDWEFIDAPLPYQAMLDGQYGDEGVQVRWLAPLPIFTEFGAEVFRGDAFPGGNAPRAGTGTQSLFVHLGDDIDESSSWKAGLSYLGTQADDRDVTGDGANIFDGHDHLGIGSLVYKWAPDGNPVQRNLALSGEYFFREENGVFNGVPISGDQDGWYLQGVYQFMPQWKVGLRYDTVHADAVDPGLTGSVLDPQGLTPKRESALVEYDTSEFGRIRLQYSHDQDQPTDNDALMLQYTVIFGPHGAHIF
jgi:hypothetical protein